MAAPKLQALRPRCQLCFIPQKREDIIPRAQRGKLQRPRCGNRADAADHPAKNENKLSQSVQKDRAAHSAQNATAGRDARAQHDNL